MCHDGQTVLSRFPVGWCCWCCPRHCFYFCVQFYLFLRVCLWVRFATNTHRFRAEWELLLACCVTGTRVPKARMKVSVYCTSDCHLKYRQEPATVSCSCKHPCLICLFVIVYLAFSVEGETNVLPAFHVWRLLTASFIKSHYQNVSFGAWTNELCKGWYCMLEAVKKCEQEENTRFFFCFFLWVCNIWVSRRLESQPFPQLFLLKVAATSILSSQMSGLT